MWPMVEYAHKIGKNTAEFTVTDMVNFTKWFIKQPSTKGTKVTPEQRKEYEADVEAMKQWRKGEKKMETNEEVVCSMELTKVDVESMLWALHEIFENYDLTGTPYDASLKSLQEGLMGVE